MESEGESTIKCADLRDIAVTQCCPEEDTRMGRCFVHAVQKMKGIGVLSSIFAQPVAEISRCCSGGNLVSNSRICVLDAIDRVESKIKAHHFTAAAFLDDVAELKMRIEGVGPALSTMDHFIVTIAFNETDTLNTSKYLAGRLSALLPVFPQLVVSTKIDIKPIDDYEAVKLSQKLERLIDNGHLAAELSMRHAPTMIDAVVVEDSVPQTLPPTKPPKVTASPTTSTPTMAPTTIPRDTSCIDGGCPCVTPCSASLLNPKPWCRVDGACDGKAKVHGTYGYYWGQCSLDKCSRSGIDDDNKDDDNTCGVASWEVPYGPWSPCHPTDELSALNACTLSNASALIGQKVARVVYAE